MLRNDEFVIYGPPGEEPVPSGTLGKIIYGSISSAKMNDPVMVDAYSEKAISYKTLLDETCHLSEALRKYGCTTQTVLSICSENSLKFFVPVIASLFTGTIMAPLNHSYTEHELLHSLRISKPRIVFCSQQVAQKFVRVKNQVNFIDKIIVIDVENVPTGTQSLKDFTEEQLLGHHVLPHSFQPFNINPLDQAAFILCSSGTTGLPKGVVLTHRNIAVALAHARDSRYHSVGNNTLLGLLPFFHCYGLVTGLSGIANNELNVVLQRFEADAFLKAIQDYKISCLILVPPLAIFLAKTPKLAQYDLSCVIDIMCGAAPLSQGTEIKLLERLKLNSMRQLYGLTETSFSVTFIDLDDKKPGSSGKVKSFMSLKIHDLETRKSLGPHQVGEICVKGPMVMKGYYNNEKATTETFTPDGWLKTGDLGYYDEENYFYVVDRLKELIKYKGFQVAPAEVEAVLINHPKVDDVGVVGLPDEASGELPLAFVVKKQGAQIGETELQDYVAKILSPHNWLRGGVVFLSSISRSSSGKILRRELRKELDKYKKQIF